MQNLLHKFSWKLQNQIYVSKNSELRQRNKISANTVENQNMWASLFAIDTSRSFGLQTLNSYIKRPILTFKMSVPNVEKWICG